MIGVGYDKSQNKLDRNYMGYDKHELAGQGLYGMTR